MEIMEYKDYCGTITVDLKGYVIGSDGKITYYGKTMQEIR